MQNIRISRIYLVLDNSNGQIIYWHLCILINENYLDDFIVM